MANVPPLTCKLPRARTNGSITTAECGVLMETGTRFCEPRLEHYAFRDISANNRQPYGALPVTSLTIMTCWRREVNSNCWYAFRT
jgi:hypothetical protein